MYVLESVGFNGSWWLSCATSSCRNVLLLMPPRSTVSELPLAPPIDDVASVPPAAAANIRGMTSLIGFVIAVTPLRSGRRGRRRCCLPSRAHRANSPDDDRCCRHDPPPYRPAAEKAPAAARRPAATVTSG